MDLHSSSRKVLITDETSQASDQQSEQDDKFLGVTPLDDHPFQKGITTEFILIQIKICLWWTLFWRWVFSLEEIDNLHSMCIVC